MRSGSGIATSSGDREGRSVPVQGAKSIGAVKKSTTLLPGSVRLRGRRAFNTSFGTYPWLVRELPATADLSCRIRRTSFRGIPVVVAEHVVGPLLVADHVHRILGCRVLRRLVRPNAGRHRRHWPINIAVTEEGEAVALAIGAVDRAVGGGEGNNRWSSVAVTVRR